MASEEESVAPPPQAGPLPSHIEGVIEHADGRRTTYVECGTRDGAPVLYFHPLQANRYMALIFAEDAERLGLRVIALDRPGYGGSTFAAGRKVADWPALVADACERLGITRFSILASSAGALYATACAVSEKTRHMIDGKVTLVAPWVPPSQWPAGIPMPATPTLGRWAPSPLLYAFQALSLRRNASMARKGRLRELMVTRTEVEREAFFSRPGWEAAYVAMIEEQLRAGTSGIVHELAYCCMERGGNLLGYLYTRDVALPVRIFAGADDGFVPLPVLHRWAEIGKRVELIVVAGGTHDGVMATHGPGEALRLLAADLAPEGR